MTLEDPNEDPVVSTCPRCHVRYRGSEFPRLLGCRYVQEATGALWEYRDCRCGNTIRASKGKVTPPCPK